MFCCQGNDEGSTGASLAGRGTSFGAGPLMAASAIVSAAIVAGLSVWRAAANGSDAALVLRKLRRLSMRIIMADHTLPYEQEKRKQTTSSLVQVWWKAIPFIRSEHPATVAERIALMSHLTPYMCSASRRIVTAVIAVRNGGVEALG